MIRRGWDHEALMRMAEHEFSYWMEQTLNYDRAEQEAHRRAAEKARR